MATSTTETLPRRQLLHDIRGRMNGLQLCVAALDATQTKSERVEFLDDILMLCDKLDRLVAKLESTPPPDETTAPQPE